MKDCANLFKYCRLYKAKSEVKKITHFPAPGRVTYDNAIKGLAGGGKEAKVGDSFGPT